MRSFDIPFHQILEALANDMDSDLIVVRTCLEQGRPAAEVLELLESAEKSIDCLFSLAEHARSAGNTDNPDGKASSRDPKDDLRLN